MSDRWATFDCYGTLVDWRGGIEAELARLFGAELAPPLLERYFAHEADVQREGAPTYRDALAGALARTAAEAGLALPAGEEDALARSLPAWPVFVEVPGALAEAQRRGWRLAILSNSDRDLIEASIAAVGVRFDLAVVAGELGSFKPAHRHWEVFRETTRADPRRHVHVAQSPFHDLVPCAELGIPCVWVNRLGGEPPVDVAADVPDLVELPSMLDGLVPA